MNKKQLIVAWIMGILISLTCIYTPIRTRMDTAYPNATLERIFIFNIRVGAVDSPLLIVELIPILVIGGLLIYTLRDKKE